MVSAVLLANCHHWFAAVSDAVDVVSDVVTLMSEDPPSYALYATFVTAAVVAVGALAWAGARFH